MSAAETFTWWDFFAAVGIAWTACLGIVGLCLLAAWAESRAYRRYSETDPRLFVPRSWVEDERRRKERSS